MVVLSRLLDVRVWSQAGGLGRRYKVVSHQQVDGMLSHGKEFDPQGEEDREEKVTRG